MQIDSKERECDRESGGGEREKKENQLMDQIVETNSFRLKDHKRRPNERKAKTLSSRRFFRENVFFADKDHLLSF